MRYFRFAQSSPKNDIHVKQESNPPFLGIVGDKKSSPFFNLDVQSPIFLQPKLLKMAVLGAKKWDFRCPNPKTETLFCHQLSPKMVVKTLFHLNIIYKRVLGKL